MEREEIVTHWLESSDDDYKVMQSLFRYPDYKNRFQKKADQQYTEKQIIEAKKIREWLLAKINS